VPGVSIVKLSCRVCRLLSCRAGCVVHPRQLWSGTESEQTATELVGRVQCEDRIGTGPPWARTEVIYVDLGYWAISGSIPPEGDPALWGINSSVSKCSPASFCTEGASSLDLPLSSEHGTCKTVKARFWPWLFTINSSNRFESFSLRRKGKAQVLDDVGRR